MVVNVVTNLIQWKVIAYPVQFHGFISGRGMATNIVAKTPSLPVCTIITFSGIWTVLLWDRASRTSLLTPSKGSNVDVKIAMWWLTEAGPCTVLSYKLFSLQHKYADHISRFCTRFAPAQQTTIGTIFELILCTTRLFSSAP